MVHSYAEHLHLNPLSLIEQEQRLVAKLRDTDYLVVLNLHRVSPHSTAFWPALHPNDFEELLRVLLSYFEVTCFSKISSVGDRPAAVLSFDDGYYDFLEYAAPLLHKYGVAANQNVVVSSVRTGKPIWNVQLYDLLAAAPISLVRRIRIAGCAATLKGDDDHSKMRFATALSGFLKSRSRVERAPLLSEIMQLLEPVEVKDPVRTMTLADVRQAAAEHDIGAHSCDHDSMYFETAAFFLQDLERCEDFFLKEVGHPLGIYAFPNGSYRNEQIDILENRGFERILLVDERVGRRGDRVCPRLSIAAQSLRALRLEALAMNARGGFA